MLRQTDLYEEAKRRYQELLNARQELENSSVKALPGKIHIVSSAKRTQFYLREESSDKSGKYISKSDEGTIKQYLQKAYNEKALKLLNLEVSNLEKLLKHSEEINKKVQDLYSDNPNEVKKYIVPIDVSDDEYANMWANKSFIGKAYNDELPYYETDNKERVRSKSELNIANALYKYGIPYKYECPLRLSNGKVIFPDFTILDIKARKEVYWEHRGMMDDRQYATDSVMRIKTLMKNGVYLGKNLIITEETSTNPLGTDEIEMMIKKYFGW